MVHRNNNNSKSNLGNTTSSLMETEPYELHDRASSAKQDLYEYTGKNNKKGDNTFEVTQYEDEDNDTNGFIDNSEEANDSDNAVNNTGLETSNNDNTEGMQIHPLNDEDDTSVIITFNQKMSPFVLVLTFVASISGFMFGYDTGYISTALISVGTDLSHKSLTYGNKEIITAATSLGALITSTIAGLSADYFGRRPCLMFSNLLFLIGAILQVTSFYFWQMVVGRFIMGFGVGFGSLIAPLFISEIAPKHIRGRLTVINSLCLTGGQLVAYAIGAGLSKVHNGWRGLVGISMFPSLVQLVMFIFLPDTPRYYVMIGNLAKAREVLKKSYVDASEDIINEKIKELVELNKSIPGKNILQKGWNTVKELHTVPSNFRALIIGCALQGMQQFTGWNALMYFSGTIFESVGFKDSASVSIIIAATNFVFTTIAFFVIDRVGRRFILLLGMPFMITFLVINAIGFHFLNMKFVGNDVIVENGGFSAWRIVIIVMMVAFAASYAIGIGTVPWQQSELFPQAVRGVGTSYCTATNWAGSLIISSTFLTMLKTITPTGTFALFAAFSTVSLIGVYFCYPELSGLELEEVQLVLTGGFQIKASTQLAKRRKREHADMVARHQRELENGIGDDPDGNVWVTKEKPTDEIIESNI
ncbi:myo-inositol transporter ITR1 SCDLUD_002570 [Saccharomycodes ludwigii]|uniref:myo-inositol transporter ITR1 n=1 Tax=Saccharomycodes ludwigii TaxID=36035 RepID=UPI001E88F1B8|nr:hypothetical protein SCDLUD_002570 [Saccharomycodes ludwigii]KAH3901094.1 hypothetical protein SCDLUD_002570 [Saccharomycodes ludwigii]